MGFQYNQVADQAILIVAHGERGGRNDNARLLELTNEIRCNLGNVEVEAGVLRGTPTLKEAWNKLTAPHRMIYPFFMADGYFSTRILPKKIAEAIGEDPRLPHSPLCMLPPFGVSPLLAEAVTGALVREIRRLGLTRQQPNLLIAAHGASVDRQSSKRANDLAAQLRLSGYFGSVACAFLDEAPYLKDVIGAQAPNTLVLPLFNGLGSHSIDDMAKLATIAPPQVHFLTPVGGQAWVGDIMTADIQSALTWSQQAMAAE